MDVDDNGIINMLDLYDVALRYGATGTPINKTALVTDLENRIAALEAKFPVNDTNLAANAIPYLYVELTDGPNQLPTGPDWGSILDTNYFYTHLELNRNSHVIMTLTGQFETTDFVDVNIIIYNYHNTNEWYQPNPGPMTILQTDNHAVNTGWHLLTCVYTYDLPPGSWRMIAYGRRHNIADGLYWFRELTVYALPA
jgi:hypothetical protein